MVASHCRHSMVIDTWPRMPNATRLRPRHPRCKTVGFVLGMSSSSQHPQQGHLGLVWTDELLASGRIQKTIVIYIYIYITHNISVSHSMVQKHSKTTWLWYYGFIVMGYYGFKMIQTPHNYGWMSWKKHIYKHIIKCKNELMCCKSNAIFFARPFVNWIVWYSYWIILGWYLDTNG